MTDMTRSPSVRTLSLEPGGEVEILLTSSDVHLRGVDADAVTVRTPGGEDVDDEVVIDEEPGTVHIRDADARFDEGPFGLRGSGAATLEIEVPRAARLTLKTLSGDVEAQGVGSDSRWSTTSGDVRIGVAGGSVTVDSMSGDVTVEAAGPVGVRARTVSGDLRLQAPLIDALQVSTTSGDIRVAGDLGAGFEHVASSVSGDVHVETDSPVRLETQTIAGEVRASGGYRAEGGRGRRTIVAGDGSVRLSVRTTSGDIRLRRRRAGEDRRAKGALDPARAPGTPASPVRPVAPAGPVPPVAPIPPFPPRVPAAGADAAAAPWVVAEAEASPNLVRQSPSAQSWGAEGITDRREAARLDILRALERGELDIEAASYRLEQLEDAGPRSFRGFC